ncbi:ParB N-terminal domain-containing protein [Azospirillum sp. TSA6c]|uniref:ParB N-terminal domain-containing protein n=1 Tax=Azospirillum sp. TSA6c TaxID=709813 RepID=UPI0011B5316C|nr:ParB N-terminal domain-containing protein [Azospirillum sp. TSA6c]
MSHNSIATPANPGPWKIRIVAYRLMPVAEILDNPRAWRTHPEKQRNALRAALDHVGLVKPLIYNERTNRLVDGRARLDLARRDGQEMLPVIIVDLSEDEEALVLATLDPLTELAEVDTEALQRLLAEVSVTDTSLMALLAEISGDVDLSSFDEQPQAGDLLDGNSGGQAPPSNAAPQQPASPPQEPTPPADFPSFGEDIETQYCCPKCGYRWSGKPNAGGGDE